MDSFNGLLDLLKQVPDPRRAEGQLYKLPFATKARAKAARSLSGRPGRPVDARHEGFDPNQAQDADQLPVVLAEWANGIVEPGEKFVLDVQPVSG